MKIGLFAPLANPFATPDYLETLARTADERGIHSLWVAEHVVLFDEYASKYPYSDDGQFPTGGTTGLYEPFTALAFLAAHSERVRLGTGICLVPQRNPVYTAKEVASVDVLSGGRFDFGVGVGWLAEEFHAVDATFERRGARCREYLEVMRTLWCDEVSEHHGELYDLPACRQYPKPVQDPHPPIHFGGESDAALRRVADVGQGWYGFNLTPDAVPERLERLDGLLADRGRSRDELTISICPYLQGADADAVRAYAEIGVDQVILMVVARDAARLEAEIARLATDVLEPAGAL